MRYSELFAHIKEISYTTSGKSVDWCIEVDEDQKIIRLLFEESNGAVDWYHNLAYFSKVYKKQHSVICAHHGFADEYKSANDEIMTALIAACDSNEGFKIVITGWSNGGAIAQLAAEDLNFRTRTNKDDPNTGLKCVLVTFGAPKVFVGNKSVDYVRSCCAQVIQIAHNNDVVTYLPPFPWFKHLWLPAESRLGKAMNLFKLFNPWKYHTSYDEIDLYNVSEPIGSENV